MTGRVLLINYPNYRVEGKVKHYHIQVEDKQYMLGSVAFDSLTELVQYCEMNPVFRGSPCDILSTARFSRDWERSAKVQLVNTSVFKKLRENVWHV